jgi:hypothetical protein
VPVQRQTSVVIGALAGVIAALGSLTWVVEAQRGGGRGGAAALAEPFVGVTTNGTAQPNVFPIRATGVSTRPVRDAATRFLTSLSAEERGRTTFAADDVEWRDWNNVHRYTRKGVNFEELSEAQRERGFDLLRASLSAPDDRGHRPADQAAHGDGGRRNRRRGQALHHRSGRGQ